MKKLLIILILLCSYLQASELIPLEDFFKNPKCSSFSLSPNGKNIAWLESWENRMNIFYRPLNSKTIKQLTHIKSRDISGFYWEGNDHIIFAKDNDGNENYHIFSININDLKETDHTPDPDVRAYIVDDLPDKDNKLLIAHNKRDKRYFDVFELDILTNTLALKAENKQNIRSWITDHNGIIKVALAINETTQKILYRDDESSPFKEILAIDFPNSFYPLAFDFKNENILSLSNINRDMMALVSFNPKTQKEAKEIFSTDEADVSNVLLSDHRKKLLGVSWHTDKRKYHFFDEKRAAIDKFLKKNFPKLDPVLIDSDKKEENFVIAVYSDINPVNYYLYSLLDNKISLLGESSPWIKPEQMSPISTYNFKARDGYPIFGYLSLPLYGAKPYPLVLIPHGGPEARNYWGFDEERQFLNNRGYAVFNVNFRGSTGFGKKHRSLGFKQWGRGIMQTDLIDAVNSLADNGIIDKNRTAIFGTSYGGYAALSALTFQNKIFSCGVSFCGPSNLFTLFDSIPPYWEGLRKLMYKKIGDPVLEKDFIKSISPLFYSDNIKVPLMIAQGKNDPRVKQSESDQIVKKLRAKKIEVPYILKDDEGHGFSNEENIIEFYKCLEAFLSKNLQGKSTTPYSFLKKYH